MALSFGFYNAFDHDRKYNAVQFSRIFDGIITDGIYATYLDAMVVKASENANEVIVQPGRAWFMGTWSYNDADCPVTAPDPEVVLDRIDTLVLDVNTEQAARENSYLWVQGTPTSQTPERPTLISTATHKQYPLCDVYRQAGTTQIYAENITNRVGTSDTPFVTGVLETINIDSLLTQWDAEFHTWENATKASFESWMINQQSVYTAWWDELKSQMAGDVADVESWIETLHNILDSETASHLQLEIDELREWTPNGSYIEITTNESDLYSRPVTVTDAGGHSETVNFDTEGHAVFKSYPYIGTLTISSTDGTRTAVDTITVPYFGRYSAEIAFWAATVNLNGDSTLGGVAVTVKDSQDVTITSIVLNASGQGVFTATYPDTYTFSYTYGGETMSVTLAVAQETVYNVELYAGFSYKNWLTAGGLDPNSYASLAAVFADQAAVRRLMLKHASADYLISMVAQDVNTLNDFVANDTAMKWIGLSNYVADGLKAISGAETKLLASTYWERYLKDHVPPMTANTSPYGECFGLTHGTNNDYYMAFDGTTGSSDYASNSSAGPTTHYIGYKFTNPIKVSRAKIRLHSWTVNSVKIQASNDNTNWTDVSSTVNNPTLETDITITVNASDYYLYYRAYMTGPNTSRYGVTTLQFYGRALDVSVPKMTSNTAPFGVASASSDNASAYLAFNGTNASGSNDAWSNQGLNNRLVYKFTSPVCVKKFSVANRNYSTVYAIKNFKLQGSNDGSAWTDLGSYTKSDGQSNEEVFSVTNSNSYLYYCIYVTSVYDSSSVKYSRVGKLQFYGEDYSEKEFESGTTKKWLYDHGVELETIATSGTVTKGANYLTLSAANAQATKSLNLTAYSLLRGKVGDHFSGTTQLIAGTTATANMTADNAPNNESLNIASVNSSLATGVKMTSAGTCDVTELWLE